MKKALFFLLFLLSQTKPSTAQSPGDYQFQFEFDSYLQEWVQGSDGAWFGFGRTNRVDLLDDLFVVKWDAENDVLLWKTKIHLPAQEVMRDIAILPAPDGGVYVGAVYDGCDYPTPEGFARLDAAGNFLWVVTTPDDYRDNERLWLVPSANGNVDFQTNKRKFVYAPDGTFLSMSNTGFGWNGLVKNNLGGYLAYGNQAVGSSNPFFALPFPDNIRYAVQTPASEWYFLGTDKLYRLNAGLDILAEKPLQHTQPWSKVFWADGACWVTGANASGESVLQRFEPTTLDVAAAYVYDKQYRVYSLLHTPDDSLLWLSGDCNFSRNTTVFLKSAPTNNPLIVPLQSVALRDIRLEKVPMSLLPALYCPPFGPYVTSIAFGPVYATVKNTGATPVSRFLVNGRFSSCWLGCPLEEQISQPFEVPLQPGESVEVLFNNNLYLLQDLGSTSTNLCFWTALPNDGLDSLPGDDRYCETFSVIVSDEEPQANAAAVRVVPNPAGERATFFLEGPDAAGWQHRIVVTNASGQVVRQEAFAGQNWVLERGELAAGLYFYQISSLNGSLSGKVVFED